MYRKLVRRGIRAVATGKVAKGAIDKSSGIQSTYCHNTVAKIPPLADPEADRRLQFAFGREVTKRVLAHEYSKDEPGREKLLSTKVRHVLGQPFGEGGLVQTYAQLYDLIADHSPSLAPVPSFMPETGMAYGPIFLDAWGTPANAEDIRLITEMSKALPSWFYIYNPGLQGVSARSILNQGQKLLFVEP